MGTEELRVGVVGAGSNTRKRHLPSLRSLPGVQVTAVVNRTPESSRRAAGELDIPRVFSHWRELVTAPDVDAVVVGTWPDLHRDVTVAALEEGKHVLTEARMSRDAGEAREMLAAYRRRPHLVAQVVPSPLTLAVDPTVHGLLGRGALGEILAVNATFHSGQFVDREGWLHWRHDIARSGHNIMELGIVYESLMRWVGDASRVFAAGAINVPFRYDPEQARDVKVAIPDHLDVIADLTSGGQAHLQLSAVTGLAPAPGIWLFGTEGTIAYDLASRTLSLGGRGDPELRPLDIPPSEEGRWKVEEEFVAAIRGKGEIRRTTFEDGVRYMEFTDAAHRSLSSGGWEDVDVSDLSPLEAAVDRY